MYAVSVTLPRVWTSSRVDLVGVLPKLGEVRPPFGAEGLGHDVLDLQVGLLEVDDLLMAEAAFELFEDLLALMPAPDVKERLAADRLADVFIAGPVEPVARQLLMQRVDERRVFRQLVDELDEHPVQGVGWDASKLTAHEEGLDQQRRPGAGPAR